jgi:hypothetical protein
MKEQKVMKIIITNISRMGLLLRLTAIAALCFALPTRAALPYPTASTGSQLTADINYANTNGGTYTINLQTNTTFTGGQAIGGTKAVNLTIIGNGDTFNGPGFGQYLSRFFVVAAGSSLTLEQVTLQNGCVYANYGGAIYNSGTLTISNCTLSGNTSIDRSDYLSSLRGVGGAIYNNGGIVIIDDSILSDNLATGANPIGGAIYNASGRVTISNSTFTDNSADDTVLGIYVDPEYPQSGEGGAICNDGGTVTISHSTLTNNYASFRGGGICNGGIYGSVGTATVENWSRISGNTIDDVQNSGTLYLDSSSEIDILDGNQATIVQGTSAPSPRIFPTRSNTVVVSWPYPSTGWSLQQNSDLTTTNWVAPTNAVANDGTNNFIIAQPSAGKLYFRLKF